MRLQPLGIILMILSLSVVGLTDRLSAKEAREKISVYFAQLTTKDEPVYILAYLKPDAAAPELRIVDTENFVKEFLKIIGKESSPTTVSSRMKPLRGMLDDLAGATPLDDKRLISLVTIVYRLERPNLFSRLVRDQPFVRLVRDQLSKERIEDIDQYIAGGALSDQLRTEIPKALNAVLEREDLADQLHATEEMRLKVHKYVNQTSVSGDRAAIRRFNRALVHKLYPWKYLKDDRGVFEDRIVLRYVPSAEPRDLGRRVDRQVLTRLSESLKEWIQRSTDELDDVSQSTEVWQVQEAGENGRIVGHFAFLHRLFLATRTPDSREQWPLAEARRVETSFIELLASIGADASDIDTPPMWELDLDSLENTCQDLKESVEVALQHPLYSAQNWSERLRSAREISKKRIPSIVWSEGPPYLLRNPGIRPRFISFQVEHESWNPLTPNNVEIPKLNLQPCSERRLVIEAGDDLQLRLDPAHAENHVNVRVLSSGYWKFGDVRADVDETVSGTYRVRLYYSTLSRRVIEWALPILLLLFARKAWKVGQNLWSSWKEGQEHLLRREELKNSSIIFRGVREQSRDTAARKEFRRKLSPDLIKMIRDYRDWDQIPSEVLSDILECVNGLISGGCLFSSATERYERRDDDTWKVKNLIHEWQDLSSSRQSEKIFRAFFEHVLVDERQSGDVKGVHFENDDFTDLRSLIGRVRTEGRGRSDSEGQVDEFPAFIWGQIREEDCRDLIDDWASYQTKCQLLVGSLNSYIEEDESKDIQQLREGVDEGFLEIVDKKSERIQHAALRRRYLENRFPGEFSKKVQGKCEKWLEGIPDQAGEDQSHRFEASDLALPGRFVARIHSAGNIVSKEIRKILADDTVAALADFAEKGSSEGEMNDQLISEINEILNGRALLYDRGQASPWKRVVNWEGFRLMGRPKENRLFLEEIFPDALECVRDRDPTSSASVRQPQEKTRRPGPGDVKRWKERLEQQASETRALRKEVGKLTQKLNDEKDGRARAEGSLKNWELNLAKIGNRPEEVSDKWRREVGWLNAVEGYLNGFDGVFKPLADRWTGVQSSLASRDEANVKRWTEDVQDTVNTVLVFAQEVTVSSYRRIYGDDTESSPDLPGDFAGIHQEYLRLERQERIYRQLERSILQSRNVLDIADGFLELADRLMDLAQSGGILAKILADIGLAPGGLAADVRGVAVDLEEQWRRSLAEESESLIEREIDQEAGSRVSRRFFESCLSGSVVRSLTEVKRFQQITTVYFTGSEDSEIVAILERVGPFQETLLEVEAHLAEIGFELAPFRFFSRVDALEGWEFQENREGRGLLLGSPRLLAMIIAKLRCQEGRLEGTLGDMSLWGFHCDDFPDLSRDSKGWLVRGWESL